MASLFLAELMLVGLLQVPDPFADLQRFPPHDYAKWQAEAARKRVEAFEFEFGITGLGEMATCRGPRCLRPCNRTRAEEIVVRLRFEWSCWITLTSATDPDRWHCGREREMASLRLMIGEEAWAAGQMPPLSHIWR